MSELILPEARVRFSYLNEEYLATLMLRGAMREVAVLDQPIVAGPNTPATKFADNPVSLVDFAIDRQMEELDFLDSRQRRWQTLKLVGAYGSVAAAAGTVSIGLREEYPVTIATTLLIGLTAAGHVIGNRILARYGRQANTQRQDDLELEALRLNVLKNLMTVGLAADRPLALDRAINNLAGSFIKSDEPPAISGQAKIICLPLEKRA